MQSCFNYKSVEKLKSYHQLIEEANKIWIMQKQLLEEENGWFKDFNRFDHEQINNFMIQLDKVIFNLNWFKTNLIERKMLMINLSKSNTSPEPFISESPLQSEKSIIKTREDYEKLLDEHDVLLCFHKSFINTQVHQLKKISYLEERTIQTNLTNLLQSEKVNLDIMMSCIMLRKSFILLCITNRFSYKHGATSETLADKDVSHQKHLPILLDNKVVVKQKKWDTPVSYNLHPKSRTNERKQIFNANIIRHSSPEYIVSETESEPSPPKKKKKSDD